MIKLAMFVILAAAGIVGSQALFNLSIDTTIAVSGLLMYLFILGLVLCKSGGKNG